MSYGIGRVMAPHLGRAANYAVGDVIAYRTFMDSERVVRVFERDPDIKHGEPGFLGHPLDPDTHEQLPPAFDLDAGVWGYDRQITRVVERAP